MFPVDQAREQIARDLRQGGVLDRRLPGYEERPAQIRMAEEVATALTNGEHLLVEAGTGTGKALDVETRIPTPTGWKRMGDLVVGDVVFDEHGQPTRVTAAFDTMEDRACFEVIFSDSSSLIADAEHEWIVYTPADRKWPGRRSPPVDKNVASGTRDRIGQRHDQRPSTLVTTAMMAQTLSVGKNSRANYAIALARPLTLPETALPIDPYFLGAWLGDRNSRSNQITSQDPEILEPIREAGYYGRPSQSSALRHVVKDESEKAKRRWQPGMTEKLRALGLFSHQHIPSVYLRASEGQRRRLLAGLLDTDGTVSVHGAIAFTTTSSQLAEQLFELICSLGYCPNMIHGHAKRYGKDWGSTWTIAFTADAPVFGLKRKQQAQSERLRNCLPQRHRYRSVVAINAVPSRPVRCIQVDAPSHLYLAGRAMIPTHNSIAYLLPVVRSDKKVLIATANKALQEQLYYKDIPFIAKHVTKVKAAMVKGMSNYLCLAKYADERTAQGQIPDRALEMVGDLLERDSFDGDLDVVPFNLPGYLRGKITTDGDDCAWRACPYYGDCYVRKMREAAAHAQIVVINHTLLLLDVLMDGWLLPNRDAIILDEAHHLEDEATRAFTVTVNARRVETLLAQKRLKQFVDNRPYEAAIAANVLCWGALTDNTRFGNASRAPLAEPFEEGLRLGTAIADVATSLRARRPEGLEETDEREAQLYDKLVRRTSQLATDLRLVFGEQDTDLFVYYLEREPGKRGKEGMISAAAAPLSVTEKLKTHLFDAMTVIATSATLALKDRSGQHDTFDFYKKRVGIDQARELVLPLAFDYAHHAVLYVPHLRYEPTFGKESGPYMDELAMEMGQLVRASRGRAFLLFTSQRTLQEIRLRLEHDLIREGYTPLVQGGEVGRAELIRRFRTGERAVLFGLRSFWEGVDIAGEALSLVAIDKLPFDPPDDPVHEVRVSRMRAAGENWFGDYVLPLAVLRLKQGVGRLLRTREDRGVLAILDTRLLSKGYGKQVILALPPARRTTRIEVVREFFEEGDRE